MTHDGSVILIPSSLASTGCNGFMPEAAARMPSAAEAVELIASHLEDYVDGGSDREAECLALAKQCGLQPEGIAARWAKAKAARPKPAPVILPTTVQASQPKPSAPFVRR